MSTNVQFIKLPAFRVASAIGFGDQPETEAWRKIFVWLKKHGLFNDLKARRFFGFNNPNPSPGSPNYGYEQWVTVPDDAQTEGDVKIFDFKGGYYAVLDCELLNIGEKWSELVNWQAGSKYRMAPEQCLEECMNPEILVDAPEDKPFSIENVGKMHMRLYLPIIEGE